MSTLATLSTKPLYGGTQISHLWEMKGVEYALRKFLPKTWEYNPKLNILELFAGNEENGNVLRSLGIPIDTYVSVDGFAPDAQIKANLAYASVSLQSLIPKKLAKTKWDAVFALYNSPETTVRDSEFNITRELVLNVFRNMASVCTPAHTLAIVSYSGSYNEQVFENTLNEKSEAEDTFDYFTVPSFYEQFKALDHALPTTLEYAITNKYNRLSATLKIFFSRIKVKQNDKVKFTLDIAEPFSFRYWSESELLDIARDAGFNQFHMLAFEDDIYRPSFVWEVDPVVTNSEEYKETELLVFLK